MIQSGDGMNKNIFLYHMIYICLFAVVLFLPFYAETNNYENFFSAFTFSFKDSYQLITLPFSDGFFIKGCTIAMMLYLCYRLVTIKKEKFYPVSSFIIMMVNILFYYLLNNTMTKTTIGFDSLSELLFLDFFVNLFIILYTERKNDYIVNKIALIVTYILFIIVLLFVPLHIVNILNCETRIGCTKMIETKTLTVWVLYQHMELIIALVLTLVLKFCLTIKIEKHRIFLVFLNLFIFLLLYTIFDYNSMIYPWTIMQSGMNVPIFYLIALTMTDIFFLFAPIRIRRKIKMVDINKWFLND